MLTLLQFQMNMDQTDMSYFRNWCIVISRNGLFLLKPIRQHLTDVLSDAIGNIADKHPTLGLIPMQCIPLHTAIKLFLNNTSIINLSPNQFPVVLIFCTSILSTDQEFPARNAINAHAHISMVNDEFLLPIQKIFLQCTCWLHAPADQSAGRCHCVYVAVEEPVPPTSSSPIFSLVDSGFRTAPDTPTLHHSMGIMSCSVDCTIQTEKIRLRGNVPDLHSGYSQFEFWQRYILSWHISCGVSLSFLETVGVLP
jgi:hypothetical protein